VSLIRQSPPVAASNMKANKCWSVPFLPGQRKKESTLGLALPLWKKESTEITLFYENYT
jgi:hypothetical protein